MPALADTTVRLLGQEPLAGRLPTAEQLRIAEILDTAGFAYLEVSGGGCFDSAVERGVESPWERIRALKARVETPLGLALRCCPSSAPCACSSTTRPARCSRTRRRSSCADSRTRAACPSASTCRAP